MKKIKLNEDDLNRIIMKVLSEQESVPQNNIGESIESCVYKGVSDLGGSRLNLKNDEIYSILTTCKPGGDMVGCFTKGVEIGLNHGKVVGDLIIKIAPSIPKVIESCVRKYRQ